MKKLTLSLYLTVFVLSAFSGEYLPPELRARKLKSAALLKLDSPQWQKIRPLPLYKRADLAGDFQKMPVEKGSVKLLFSGKTLYVRGELSDSEILSEPVAGTTPFLGAGDTFLLILSPLSETGYFDIQFTPDGRVYCQYVLGPGTNRLQSAKLPVKTKITVKTRINGKINDNKKDVSWEILAAVPLDELLKELAAAGFDVKPGAGWSLMAARKNYSSALERVEDSGYPQPVRDFYRCRHIHARLK